MQLLLRFFFSLLLLIVCTGVFCQNDKKTTIIIVRHAEKDTGNNPPLTAKGMIRAEKLSDNFPGIKPDKIYSTPYTRTMQTITPWAKEAAVEINEYNPKNMLEFVKSLQTLKGKNIVIAGHSNTNPQLVNLLINEEKFKNLDDMDYDTIFIVTIKKGVSKVRLMKNKF